MISQSTIFMTIIDFLIIGSVGYSLYAFVSHQKHLSPSKASLSLIAGLGEEEPALDHQAGEGDQGGEHGANSGHRQVKL
jgi:hypothetical protein